MRINCVSRRLFGVILISLSVCAFAQDTEMFRIADVVYDIDGNTRQFPLSRAVPIDKKRLFAGKTNLDAYLSDIRMQLSNQRVLESVSIDVGFGEQDESGVIPVSLTIHTVDTWNIIALPYPKFDSNSGFQLKLKLKNYNFFGSMQELNGDLIYELGNDGESTFETNLDFDIPFEFSGYSMSWNNDFSAEFPQGEIPEFNIGTGLSIDIPVSFTKIVLGLDQTIVINDRDDNALYEDDPLYFNEKVSAAVPFSLWESHGFGNLVWSPNASVSTNLAFDGIQSDDLKGPKLGWGQTLSLGRVNWYGNLRKGMSAEASNDFSYNLSTSDKIDVSVSLAVAGYTSFFDRLGLYSRVKGFYNFGGNVSENIGDPIRGIMNNRIDSDTALSLNVDVPIKILDVDFEEITGVRWTRYIGFEMQASPFFDMMLTHDENTDRMYSPSDGWYSGGFELIVYPKKMRSIYGRISAGFDLGDIAENGWKLRDRAERDDSSTHELFIGIGLHY